MTGKAKSSGAAGGDGELVDGRKVARVRSAMASDETIGALSETFRALGDATRTRIVFALSREELCVCDLAALLGVTQSAVSHQLRGLRSLKLVRTRRDGRLVYYALDDAHVTMLYTQALDHVDHRAPEDE